MILFTTKNSPYSIMYELFYVPSLSMAEESGCISSLIRRKDILASCYS